MTNRIILGLAVSTALLASGGAALAEPGWAFETSRQIDNDDKDENDSDDGQTTFAGLKFGAGISVTIDFSGIDRVASAEVVNGIVRVTDEEDARARVMLESHYFFTPPGTPFGVAQGNWGIGPFVALQPGTDEIIEAAALGVMIGFKRGNTDQSFNVGIGVAVDPNTQVLGEGLRANQPLPVGETQIRYKEESQYGLVLLTSFSF